MYEVETFCLIDGSKMKWIGDASKHFYHCDACGFEYWWLCTEEQARAEAEKYLQKLFEDDKITEIAEKVKRQISELPREEELKKRAEKFYNKLKEDNNLDIGQLEKNLRILNSGKEKILKNMENITINYIKIRNNNGIR